MSPQPILTSETRDRAAAASRAAGPPRRPRRPRRAAVAAARLAALALAFAPLAAARGPGDPGQAGDPSQSAERDRSAPAPARAAEAGEPGESGATGPSGGPVEPAGAPVEPAGVVIESTRLPVERRIDRVIRCGPNETGGVFRLDHGGEAFQGHVMMIGEDGEAVRMEVEPDGEGGFHWVERNAEGEVVAERALDEIAEPGEPRVRAVFIGEEGAAPFEVKCGPGEEEGDCPPGFRFGYHFIDPEGMGAHRGYLGAALTELSPELRAHFGAPEDAGVLVARVEADSPAAAGGLAVGDVITAIDGERVAASFDLRRRVRAMDEGERATLEVIRGGRVLALAVTIAERELPEVDLRRFLWHGPGAGAEPGRPFVYRLDPEAVNEAVVELKERFAAPEIRRDVIRLRGAEGELERRIAELEQRIAELEAALERDSPPAP